MIKTILTVLLLIAPVGSIAPARWKVDVVNGFGIAQSYRVAGDSLAEAISRVEANDPGAVVLAACHVDVARCGIRGLKTENVLWMR